MIESLRDIFNVRHPAELKCRMKYRRPINFRKAPCPEIHLSL